MFSLPSARSLLAAIRPSTWSSPFGAALNAPSLALSPASLVFARQRHQFAPRQVKFLKRHKGVLPIPVGGSTKGTTLAYGDWGIRVKGNGMRITAKQLKSADEALRRKLRPIKGAKVYMRVFPDVPVCIKVRPPCIQGNRVKLTVHCVMKGNETRMGKGKGSFEFWATR